MTKNLSWRLSKLPTPSEITELVQNKIITQEEAKDILLKNEEQTDRDAESLQSEIKFLREMVDKLSKGGNTTVVETIRYIEQPYRNYDWYHPYQYWCGTGDSRINAVAGSSSMARAESGTNFSDIATF